MGRLYLRLKGLRAQALPLPTRLSRRAGRVAAAAAASSRPAQPFGGADSATRTPRGGGENYRKSELDLDRSVDRIAAEFDRSLEARVKSADRMMSISVFTPIALLLIAPVGGLLAGVTKPELWPIAGGLAVFAAIGLVLPESSPV